MRNDCRNLTIEHHGRGLTYSLLQLRTTHRNQVSFIGQRLC